MAGTPTDGEKRRGRASDASQASCPYVQGLEHSQIPMDSMPGLEDLQSCPAFSNKECPFKGLGSEEMAEKLKEIPKSHLESDGMFYKTLEFFHRQNSMKQEGGVVFEMGCPVKHALPPGWSFDQAMEEHSLAATIGTLAWEWESHGEDGATASSDEDGDSTRGVIVAPPPPALKPSTSLSDALKSGTALAHEAAESVHFVKNFIRGKINRDLYGLLVAQLFHVYTKLEQALDVHAPSHFGNCHYPKELHRTEALQEDVDFWHTTSNPPISPATQDYLDRIDHLARTKPLLLLAHAYTRYLGDLSGGKVLARVARRALNLSSDDAGLAFYHFEHVKSFKLFKDQYRTSLNELNLSEVEIADVVQEANVAFLLNMRLFEELDVIDNIPNATVRPLADVYARSSKAAHSHGSTEDEAAQQCPFLVKNSKAPTKVDTSIGTKSHSGGVCPWPFILLHDPKTGMKKWQSWLVIGLVLAYLFQSVNAAEITPASFNRKQRK